MAILADDVKAILDTDIPEVDILAYINSATELVNYAIGSSLADGLKDEVIRWLSAHLIASTREQQLQSASAGPAKAVFQGKSGLGLDSTQYGQQAKALDLSGKLAMLGQKAATLFAIESF